jgi:ADP-ribosylglycohydrolase
MPSEILFGAIAGNIIGSRFEHSPHKSLDFELFSPECRFTADTVLTVAVADALVSGRDYKPVLLEYGRRYPEIGYGSSFYQWLHATNPQPYRGIGNGSAMRVSAVGWAFDSPEEVLREAEYSAYPTHNHPEGIKGAQAVALSVFLARSGRDRAAIRQELGWRFGYHFERSLAEIRPGYRLDNSCPDSVPQSILAFLEAESVEDAIRKAISLGGDADTMACIAGAIAEAYFKGIPDTMVSNVRSRLPAEFLDVIERFNKKFS